MKKYFFIYFTTFLFFLSACEKQSDRESGEQSVLDKAMTLIENGKNEEAIAVVKEDLKKNPNSDQAHEILASAYANRAGVRVENFYGFTFSYDALIKGPQDFQFHSSDQDPIDLSKVFTGLPPEARNALQNFSANLYIIQSIHNRVSQIPLVNDAQIKDLLLATDTLATTTSPGAHMYRVVLEIIILRASLEQNFQLIQSAASSGVNCHSNFDVAMQSVEFTFQTIAQLLGDISIGYPSKADDLSKTKNQLDLVIKDLPDRAQQTRLLLCSGS